jgi:DNA-binding transcriptional ArsR family regulator/rhodanese-related sulfurtransferase
LNVTQGKTDLYDGFAAAAQALSSGRRVELLDVLAQGERPVDELARTLDLSVANCSQHLQVLRRAGLVSARREGNRIWYRLASGSVAALVGLLREVAYDRSAQVRDAAEAYLGGQVEAIDRRELVARLGRRKVLLVDVRPRREFDAGHLPGAVSIPLDELETRIDELPENVEVVAYCRGRFCAFAHQAVRILEAAGRKAVRLDVGLPEWRLAGLTVEMAS